MKILLACILSASISFLFSGDSQFVSQPCMSLLFYNTENFFHPSDDLLPGDDEFTPEGLRHWTYSRYRAKLNGIARIMYAAGGWGAPDITGLCEIENRQVLEDLVHHPLLLKSDLNILHADGPDPRGIDIGILYRPDRIQVLAWKRRPIFFDGSVLATREMIQVTALLKCGDTIDLFFNHWTSKYGGVAATDEKRLAIAIQLSTVLDSLKSVAPGHLLLVCGDLNDASSSASVQTLSREGKRLSECLPEGGEGSYKYQGKWELIDHVFTANCNERYSFQCRLLNLPQLLEPDDSFNGVKPFRTYSGYIYKGGYSDHLPLLFSLFLAD